MNSANKKTVSQTSHKEKLSFKHRQVLANLRLEGIELCAEALDDILAFDADQLSKQDVIAHAAGRTQVGETAEIAKARLEAMANKLESEG